MFGHNKIYSPKSYKLIPEESLQITSIFFTLQGEGPFAGRPAVFVRLTGCNLQCSFCDTFFDAGDVLCYNEIFAKIIDCVLTFYVKHELKVPNSLFDHLLLVITGGEPLLQRNLTGFLNEAHNRRFDTQIESNGTIFTLIPYETHLVVSPKINEKINRYVKVHEDIMSRVDTLKFVISADMPGYTDVPQFALEWLDLYRGNPRKNIYVSPMNMYLKQPIKLGADGTLEGRSETDERISFWTPDLLDMKKNQMNHEHAAFIAMKYGIKLSLQTHLMASLP